MKTAGSAAARRKPEGLRGIHVFVIVAGFFAVTFAVNGFFIARAVGTFPGEDVKNSYVQGNDFNATLAQRAHQLQLGWTAEAGLERGDAKQAFAFRLNHADGKPVSGMAVKVRWRWIGRDVAEREMDLRERAPGEYAGEIAATGSGRISVMMDVRYPSEARTVFTASKTLVIG